MEASVIRKKTSLQEGILKVLNDQVAAEAYSSAIYLSMSSWCFVQGYVETARFYRKQSEEERVHMFKIFDYILDMGGLAISPEIKNVPTEFDDLRAILDKTLDMEIGITERFNKMSKKCFEANDFQTFSFLQWFLTEQKEEEDQARRCIELYELIGIESGGLFKIDTQIGKLVKA